MPESDYSPNVAPMSEDLTERIRAVAKTPDERERLDNARLKYNLVFGSRARMKAVSDRAIGEIFHKDEAPYIRPHFDTRGNLFHTFPGMAALNYSRRVTRKIRDGVFGEGEEEQRDAANSAVSVLYGRHIARQEATFRSIEVLTDQFGVVAVKPEVVLSGDGVLLGFMLALWLPHEFMVVPSEKNKGVADAVLFKTYETVKGQNVARWLYYDAEFMRVLDSQFEDCTNESGLVRFAEDEREHGGHGARALPVVFFRATGVYGSFFDSCAASDMLLADSMKAFAAFADSTHKFHTSNFGVDVVTGDLSKEDEERLARAYFSPLTTVRIAGGGTYQRVSRELNVANVSKPAEDLLRDVAPRYGLSYDETRLITTQQSGVSRFLAREKLYDYVRGKRPLFRAAEAELFALMCGYIIDAGNDVHPELAALQHDEFDDVQAIPELAALQVEYEDFRPLETAYERIAAERQAAEAGLVSPADLIAEREPDLTHEEALDRAFRVALENRELKATATPAAANPLATLLAGASAPTPPTPPTPAPGGGNGGSV